MICSREAKVVLCCLIVHVCVFAMWFLSAAPAGYAEIQLLLLIVPTALGFVSSFGCLHKSGFFDRTVGIFGLAWFGLLLVWVLFVSVW
jgi:hypothetical protein